MSLPTSRRKTLAHHFKLAVTQRVVNLNQINDNMMMNLTARSILWTTAAVPTTKMKSNVNQETKVYLSLSIMGRATIEIQGHLLDHVGKMRSLSTAAQAIRTEVEVGTPEVVAIIDMLLAPGRAEVGVTTAEEMIVMDLLQEMIVMASLQEMIVMDLLQEMIGMVSLQEMIGMASLQGMTDQEMTDIAVEATGEVAEMIAMTQGGDGIVAK